MGSVKIQTISLLKFLNNFYLYIHKKLMSDLPPNLTIKQWDPDNSPREKLKEKGSKALSVAELLAIIIGSGSRGESAVELMKRILHHQKTD